MGLLQNLEGWLGFGKKKNQTAQNTAAISNAITAAKAKLAATQAFVEAIKPFADENPVFAAAIAVEEPVEAETETVLTWLGSLVPAPANPVPAAPSTPPVNPA